MKRNAVAFTSGLLFAVGLALAGMTRPSKVIGFLDFAGDWDPSLAFVMVGAIGVHLLVMRWVDAAAGPLLAPSFQIPTERDVDGPLIAGAALFGVGWGLAGYCPGPAVTSFGSLAPSTITFIVSMLVGMLLFAVLERVRARSQASASPPPSRECVPDPKP